MSSVFLNSVAVLKGARAAMKVSAVTRGERVGIISDGVAIVERGRLKTLDDPEIREIAKKYGDPDRLLAEAL